MRMRCSVCNWVYDEKKEGTSFDALPGDYTCPVCGAPKSAFVPMGDDVDVEGPKVAEVLVQQLVEIGVTRVYGIPGDSNLPLVEALRQHTDIDLVMTRHEQTAAFMASAHAKLTGELGVCLSIAGPGATNLITGLMDATTDRAPVLALVGQVAGVYLGSESFQEIDQIEMFRSFAAFAETLAIPSQLPRLFGMAVKAAYGAPGVSVLSIPTDTLAAPAVDETWDKSTRMFNPRMVPNGQDLDRAAAMINRAEHPAVFAGWGSRRYGKLLADFVSKLDAPLATTSRAKGVYPEGDSRALGVLGSIGNPHAPPVLAEADLLIVLGTGFRQRNLLGDVPILQIDHDPIRLGRNFSVDLGLVGDVGASLEALLPKIDEREMSYRMKALVTQARQRWMAERDEPVESEGFVHPRRVIQALKDHLDDDAIVTVDVGDHTYWFYRYFPVVEQFTLMSASMASMAFGLPAALSAAMAEPNRQVVCVTGDGGFGMLMADFTTAVREDINVKVIVFNDDCLKNIKKEQKRDGYPYYGVDFVNPDFAAFARSAGAMGTSVEQDDQLDEALDRTLSSEGPALIDVKIDPDVMLPGVKRIEQ